MSDTVLVNIEELLEGCIHSAAKVLDVSAIHIGRKTLRLTGGTGVEVPAAFSIKIGDEVTVYLSDGMPGPIQPSHAEIIAFIRNKRTQDGVIPL